MLKFALSVNRKMCMRLHEQVAWSWVQTLQLFLVIFWTWEYLKSHPFQGQLFYNKLPTKHKKNEKSSKNYLFTFPRTRPSLQSFFGIEGQVESSNQFFCPPPIDSCTGDDQFSIDPNLFHPIINDYVAVTMPTIAHTTDFQWSGQMSETCSYQRLVLSGSSMEPILASSGLRYSFCWSSM